MFQLKKDSIPYPFKIFIVLLVVPIVLLAGCGGGGGGSFSFPNIPPPAGQTGGIQGYVYVPIGGARVTGQEAIGVMRAVNVAPAGYLPLSGAIVNCGGKSATTNINGYYSISGITVGTATVTITKDGYQTITTQVSISNGVTLTVTSEGSISGVLYPTSSGSIYVNSTPPGATIYLDDENTSFTTPRTFSNVKAGNHQVYVALSGYNTPAAHTVNVTSGMTTTHSFTLTPGSGVLVTASAFPSIGTILDNFTLTCSVSGGTATSLEGRCDS
ncbi:MAG TPA: PEGA domain-containing protein, partial [bacterium]|nr:PEGA domain-containing protein [bacterium]